MVNGSGDGRNGGLRFSSISVLITLSSSRFCRRENRTQRRLTEAEEKYLILAFALSSFVYLRQFCFRGYITEKRVFLPGLLFLTSLLRTRLKTDTKSFREKAAEIRDVAQYSINKGR